MLAWRFAMLCQGMVSLFCCDFLGAFARWPSAHPGAGPPSAAGGPSGRAARLGVRGGQGTLRETKLRRSKLEAGRASLLRTASARASVCRGSLFLVLTLSSLSLSLSLFSFARAMAKGKFPSLSLSPPRTLPLALTLTHVNLLPEDRTSNSGHSDYSPVPQSSGAQSPYHPEALLCKFPHSVPEVGLVGVVHSLAQGVHLRVFTLLSSVFGVMAQDSWAWCIGTNKRKIEFEILVLLKPYKPQTRNPNLRSHNPQPYADQCHPTANATHPCPNHDNV